MDENNINNQLSEQPSNDNLPKPKIWDIITRKKKFVVWALVIVAVVLISKAIFYLVGAAPFLLVEKISTPNPITESQKTELLNYAENKYSEKFTMIDSGVTGSIDTPTAYFVILESTKSPKIKFMASKDKRTSNYFESYQQNKVKFNNNLKYTNIIKPILGESIVVDTADYETLFNVNILSENLTKNDIEAKKDVLFNLFNQIQKDQTGKEIDFAISHVTNIQKCNKPLDVSITSGLLEIERNCFIEKSLYKEDEENNDFKYIFSINKKISVNTAGEFIRIGLDQANSLHDEN